MLTEMDAQPPTTSSAQERVSRPAWQTARLVLAVAYNRAVTQLFWRVLGQMTLRSWGAQLGRQVRISGPLRLYISGKLVIDDNAALLSGRANFVGSDRRMTIHVGGKGRLRIGKRCGISNSTIVAVNNIEILDDTFIGGGCDIYDTDFHAIEMNDRLSDAPPASRPIRIGPAAFVGAHCLILKGVMIGQGAVIAAGSVVTRDVPAFEIWGGRPARFIRKLARAAEEVSR